MRDHGHNFRAQSYGERQTRTNKLEAHAAFVLYAQLRETWLEAGECQVCPLKTQICFSYCIIANKGPTKDKNLIHFTEVSKAE